MIKVNVEENNKSWKRKIKNPKIYFNKKLKRISKIASGTTRLSSDCSPVLISQNDSTCFDRKSSGLCCRSLSIENANLNPSVIASLKPILRAFPLPLLG